LWTTVVKSVVDYFTSGVYVENLFMCVRNFKGI